MVLLISDDTLFFSNFMLGIMVYCDAAAFQTTSKHTISTYVYMDVDGVQKRTGLHVHIILGINKNVQLAHFTLKSCSCFQNTPTISTIPAHKILCIKNETIEVNTVRTYIEKVKKKRPPATMSLYTDNIHPCGCC